MEMRNDGLQMLLTKSSKFNLSHFQHTTVKIMEVLTK